MHTPYLENLIGSQSSPIAALTQQAHGARRQLIRSLHLGLLSCALMIFSKGGGSGGDGHRW